MLVGSSQTRPSQVRLGPRTTGNMKLIFHVSGTIRLECEPICVDTSPAPLRGLENRVVRAICPVTSAFAFGNMKISLGCKSLAT